MIKSTRGRLGAIGISLATAGVTLVLPGSNATAAPSTSAPSKVLSHPVSANSADSTLATTRGLSVAGRTPKVATADPAVAALAKQAKISISQAQARLTAQERGRKVADKLVASLGSKTGGAYFNADGRLVVTVTDRSLVSRVERAGVAVRVVKHSTAALNATKARLDKIAPKNTVTSVDVVGNRVTRTTERVSTLAYTAGGVAIYHVGGGRCSAGFNVKANSNPTYKYTLTAGHCTALAGPYWNNWNGGALGWTAGSVFPGRDFGAIYQTGAAVPALSGVYLYNGYYMPTTYAANPYVGQYLCRSGSTTGVHCGYVTALNATVNYPGATVYGTIRTSICAEPGDSGGSLFSGNGGYGTLSGGSGNCTFGGTTFYQPLPFALSYWNLSLA